MIDVNQLKPGDRVVLNSPQRGVARRCMVEFDGIFTTAAEAIAHASQAGIVQLDTTGDLAGPFAGFIFDAHLRAAFHIEPDGSMLDDAGRAVYVEQRLGRVGMG